MSLSICGLAGPHPPCSWALPDVGVGNSSEVVGVRDSETFPGQARALLPEALPRTQHPFHLLFLPRCPPHQCQLSQSQKLRKKHSGQPPWDSPAQRFLPLSRLQAAWKAAELQTGRAQLALWFPGPESLCSFIILTRPREQEAACSGRSRTARGPAVLGHVLLSPDLHRIPRLSEAPWEVP